MDRPAHLFVKQHIARETVDAKVGPDADLAQARGAFVDGEQRLEQLFTPAARASTTLPPLKVSRMSSTSLAVRDRGKLNRMWPSAESSTGPVKISPSGKLCSPSALIHLRPPTRKVRSVPSPTIRNVSKALIASTSRFCSSLTCRQAATGSSSVTRARPEHKFGVILQRHTRLLGGRVGGILGHAPAQLPFGGPFHKDPAELRRRLGAGGLALGVDAA